MRRWCSEASQQGDVSPFHVASFEKGERDSHFALWQAVNPDMTGICCPRFGNTIMIFLDLVKSLTRLAHVHMFRGKFDQILVINEDQNDGCCLVHAINTADGSSLQDRWVIEYHLCYRYKDHPYGRVTLAISESYRASCRVFLVQRYPSYRVLVSPISCPFPIQSIAPSGFCLRRNL